MYSAASRSRSRDSRAELLAGRPRGVAQGTAARSRSLGRPRGVARDGRAESLAETAARSRSGDGRAEWLAGRPRGVACGDGSEGARHVEGKEGGGMGELTGTTRSPPSNQHVLLDLPPSRRRRPCRSWGNFGLECCRAKRRRHHSGSVHVCARMGRARAWRGRLAA